MKIRQQDIWSIGARMCQALGSTLIYPAGVVDKSAIKKMPEYPEMPYIDEKVKTEEDQELARQRFIVQMENWVSSFQRNK